MDPTDLREKLTPAARQTLDELTQDYGNQVLVAAAESSSRITGEIREISVQDIVQGAARAMPIFRRTRNTVFSRMANIYFITGLVIGSIGLIFLAVREYPTAVVQFGQSQLLLITLIGFTTAAIGMFFSWFARTRYRSFLSLGQLDVSPELVGIFLSRWQQLEVALRSVASSRFGESLAQEPISALLRQLRLEGSLSDGDLTSLRNLLDIRNKIVHTGFEGPPTLLQNGLRDADRLLSKLKADDFAPSS